MKITKYTLWSDIAPLISKEILAELKKKIKGSANFLEFFNMKIGHFTAIFSQKMPKPIEDFMEKEGVTVFEVIRKLNDFDDFIKNFSEIMESLEIKLDSDEKNAMSNLIEMSASESILTFMQEFFGHKDFGESENCTVIEYILARKKAFNNSMYQRNLSKIQMKKFKR